MNRLARAIAFIMVTAASAGCGGTGSTGVECTDDARYGLRVNVFDDATGSPVMTAGKVTIDEGSYHEESTGLLYNGNPPTYMLAMERAGTYTVTVVVDGYQRWQRTNVVVRRDQCHVELTLVAARLLR